MFSTRPALRENGATAVYIAAIAITHLLRRVVNAMLSLEAELLALSLLLFALHYLQRVLVGKRRCSGHWLVQYSAMAAYYLPTTLAIYAARAFYYSTDPIHVMTPLLVFCILSLFLSTIYFSTEIGLLFTNMRTYYLGDHTRDRCNFLMWLLFLGWGHWELRLSSGWMWVGVILFLNMTQLCTTAKAILFHKPPESTLDCHTKAVADYMQNRLKSRKSSSASPFFNAAAANSNSSQQLMDYCRYPFIVQERYWEWKCVATVEDLFNLSSRDKDICLSFSLSTLLARRYYGYNCAEEGDDKVRRFALAGLGAADGGYKRAFIIVEVQLAFLHDYFFTASLPITESGFTYTATKKSPVDTCTEGISIMALIYITVLSNELVPTMIQTLLIAVPCLFRGWLMLFGIPKSLLVQNLLASYWRPVHTAFCKLSYIPARTLPPTRMERLFRYILSNNAQEQDVLDPFQTQASGPYWSNKLGQYSILQDFNRRRSLKKELVAWFQGTMLSQPSYKFITHLPVEEEEIDMQELDNMRKLVADTLRDIDGPPTNGTRSLKINRDSAGYEYDWSWTCRQETHTDTILIWHIATCYCDMTQISNYSSVKQHHEAARALSRYCAYLVAFLPEFLPEHSLTTKQVFQRVLRDARSALGTTPTEEKEKYNTMRLLSDPSRLQIVLELAHELGMKHPKEQLSTFYKGVHLGGQLEMLNDDKVRWKVIAEFWAETILYVAPSDNAKAHIEQLAKGGEFITHLWALLSNAGILKRAEGEWHPPPSPASTATEELLTQTEITNVPTQGSVVPSNDEAPAPSIPFPSRQALGDMLKLDTMRHLVANALRDIEGPPTSGTRSLTINMDTILIWHIATWYCDMTPISDDLSVKCHHEAARALSRCCPYLVAFLMKFLPEHSLTTKQVFQRVLREAQQELGEKPTEEEKRTKIRGLQVPNQPEQWTTFHKGVELGRQLEMLSDDKIRWKVIAEFWAETILYIVPSHNAEAHIEQLAKGGESITHLLATLFNAGMSKPAEGEWHPPASTTKRGQPIEQERDHQNKNSGMSLLMMKHNQRPPPRFHKCVKAQGGSKIKLRT